jgi:hypothetical protein
MAGEKECSFWFVFCLKIIVVYSMGNCFTLNTCDINQRCVCDMFGSLCAQVSSSTSLTTATTTSAAVVHAMSSLPTSSFASIQVSLTTTTSLLQPTLPVTQIGATTHVSPTTDTLMPTSTVTTVVMSTIIQSVDAGTANIDIIVGVCSAVCGLTIFCALFLVLLLRRRRKSHDVIRADVEIPVSRKWWGFCVLLT